LNKQSGWKALTGTSDFSKIATPDATKEGKLAFDIFVDRIIGYVGNYFVKLDGKVDAFVFSGGIGESNTYLHSEVLKRIRCLGVRSAEESRGSEKGEVWEITSSGTKVLVCKTDEEGEMAYQLSVKSKE
jgi:acetate kinase